MTVCATELPYDFYAQRALSVQFSDLELSADAGLLLARQAEETVQGLRCSRVGHRYPTLCYKTVLAGFLAHGSSTIGCLSCIP